MKTLKAVAILAALAVLVCSFDLFYVVDETEQAVITQLGAPLQAVSSPGLHVKLPYVQSAVFSERRILTWSGSRVELSTRDHMPVVADVSARWRIADPLAFLRSTGTYDRAYARLDDVITPAMKARVSSENLVELVRSSSPLKAVVLEPGKADIPPAAAGPADVVLGRDKIMEAVRAEAGRALQGTGMQLVDVKLRRLTYGEGIRPMVCERMISERKAAAARLRAEGEGRQAEVQGQMEKLLQSVRSEGFRKAEEIRGKADAEAAAIYGRAYSQDPDFYSFMKTLETYKETSFENTTLILGTDTDYYKVLKGPSKK